jgi:hypothetical protein
MVTELQVACTGGTAARRDGGYCLVGSGDRPDHPAIRFCGHQVIGSGTSWQWRNGHWARARLWLKAGQRQARGRRRRRRRLRPCRVGLGSKSGADPVSQEVFPGSLAYGLLRCQVCAGSERGGGPAWQRQRNDGAESVAGPQVPAEQVGYVVCPWSPKSETRGLSSVSSASLAATSAASTG